MRKLKILLWVFLALNASVFAMQLTNVFKECPPQEPEAKQEQPQPKTDLLGQTFALTYYPVNSSDQAALSVAQSFNGYQFRITFETDSTYIRRSTKYRNQYRWTQDGDQITLNGKAYQKDGLILRDSIFQIELTPLR